jgi:hypothetical protein
MFAAAAALCLNLSTQIGESADTSAELTPFWAISFAIPPVTQPPQLKPMTTVAMTPATAPCRRRVRESP